MTKIQKYQPKTARCSEYHTKRLEMFIKYAQMAYAKLWTPCEKGTRKWMFQNEKLSFLRKRLKKRYNKLYNAREEKWIWRIKSHSFFCVCFFTGNEWLKKTLLHHKTRHNSSVMLDLQLILWYNDNARTSNGIDAE